MDIQVAHSIQLISLTDKTIIMEMLALISDSREHS